MGFNWRNPFNWFNSGNDNRFYFQNTIIGANDSPTWVGVDAEHAQTIYETIPHVRIVIDKLASMFANAKIVITDMNGEPVDNQEQNPFYRLIENPNPSQSREEFLMQYFIYQSLYGTAFNNKLGVAGSIPRVMWNLPSQYMEVLVTGKVYKQVDINDIIKGYKLCFGNTNTQSFDVDEVLMRSTPSPENPIIGSSKLQSLKMPISNIHAVLSKSNVIFNRMGAIGILSNEGSKDGMGALPLKPKEKQHVHEQYQKNYGNKANQMSLIISEANLKWQPMTYPSKDMMFYEELESDFSQIISSYGAHRDIFPSTKGATFENQNNAQKATYQDTIIPFANDYAKALTEFLGADLNGFKITFDYSHIPVLQENEKERSEVLLNKTKAIETLRNNGFEDVANEMAEDLKKK